MNFLINSGYQKKTQDVDEKHRIDYWREYICQEFVKLDCENSSMDSFEGEIRGGLNLGELRFSEVSADPQIVTRTKAQIACSNDDDFLISFQLSQNGLVKQNGRHAIITPGDFVLYDSTEPYTLDFNRRFHQLILQMPKRVLNQYLSNPEQYTAVTISGNDGIGAVLSEFVFSLVREYQQLDPVHPALADNLLNMIAMAISSSVLCQQLKQQSCSKNILKIKVLHFIENNYSNHQLSNQDIADAHGISLRYLYKLFHQHEVSLHQLIQQKRLEKSRELLKNSSYANCNLDNLSYSVGFISSAHFSRAFKKYFGICPSDFRHKNTKLILQ